LPITLLEAMAAGLPIVCLNRGPMPEVLGDAGTHCDPEDVADIVRALRAFIDSPAMRAEKSRAAVARARAFSWELCARESLSFLAGRTKHCSVAGSA
jgi:glycosyltransferase involved in cell wall biosynthesis